MKKLLFFVTTIVALSIQSCEEAEEVQVTGTQVSETEKALASRKGIIQPRLVPNQIVLKFANLSFIDDLLGSLYAKGFTVFREQCPCGDEALEIWTLDHKDPGNVEETIRSLVNHEGEADVEGDYQFEFELAQDRSLDPKNGSLRVLQALTVPNNDDSKVNIAVIDTGIDYLLYEEERAEPFLYNSKGPDGCLEEISGWNFVSNTPDVMDDHGHGTLVSKIITEELMDKNVGYQLLPIKAFDADGKGSYWDVVCAMNYVKRFPDIDIVNASFGFYGLSDQRILGRLIEDLSEKTLVVTSAGNLNKDTDSPGFEHYPSGYIMENVLAVGGYDGMPVVKDIIVNNLAVSFSNYGKVSIDLVAPYAGYDVEFKDGNGNIVDIIQVAGTSFSTAYITSRCGESFVGDLSATPMQIKEDVYNSALIAPNLKPYINGGKVVLGNIP